MTTRAFILGCIALLCFSFTSSAQDRYLDKMDRWYAKGKYEKIRRKGAIYISEHPRSGIGYAQLARANGTLAQTANRRAGHRYFQQALKDWEKAMQYEGKQVFGAMPEFHQWLLDSLRQSAEIAYRQQSLTEAKHYTAYLAKNMYDTLPFANELMGWSVAAVVESMGSPALRPDALPEWALNPNNPFTYPEYIPARDSLLAYAASLQGTPYKWAGETPKTGFDCSGFVLYVMRSQGFEFLHGTRFIKDLGWELTPEAVKPGDLVFFGSRKADGTPNVYHMGMLYRTDEGQRQVVHCVSRGVVIDDLNDGDYWTDKILFFRNIIDLDQPKP